MNSHAQIGINTKLPNPNSILEVSSNSGDPKGILTPRLSEEERDNLTYEDPKAATKVLKLSAKDNSLLIFNTTSNRYNFWNGPQLAWYNLNGGYKGPFDLPDATLTFDCTNDILITGIYEQAKDLSEAKDHVIAISVEVKEIGNYTLEVLSTNGYSFIATGTFLFKGNAIIRAVGSGTPEKTGTDTLTIRVNGKKSSCTPTINIKSNAPMTPKTILILSGSGVAKVQNVLRTGIFLQTPNNFGNLSDSKVQPSEGINVISIESSNNTSTLEGYLTKSLNKPAVDILIVDEEFSQGAKNTNLNKLISQYLYNKGVVIITSANRPKNNTQALLQEALGINSTFSSRKYNGYVNLPTIPGDIILDGPFGDINGKEIWQNDGYLKYPKDVTKYNITTTGIAFTQSYIDNNLVVYVTGSSGVEAFRHKKYNLFYYGNEDIFKDRYGFSVSYDFYAEPAQFRYFGYETNYRKQEKPSYNSILFGNLIYWALQKAQLEGINTP